MRPDLLELQQRRALTLDAARPDAVGKRHKLGLRTARENIADLCDPGSFHEYGGFTVAAQRNRRTMEDLVARTQAVVPVSTEISCNMCHNTPGMSPESDILAAHDRLYDTDLVDEKPVLCASCHGSAALGLPGRPGMPQVSTAVHGAHAPRMGAIDLQEKCYACHPDVRTQCQI